MDALPTLSPDGFTTNKNIIMLKLYEYFLSSEYSQSNTFYTRIASLKYILNESKNGEDLKSMVVDALTAMYSSYFDTVNLDIVITDTPNNISISVNILCIDSLGAKYRLSELVSVIDNKITNFNKDQETYNK